MKSTGSGGPHKDIGGAETLWKKAFNDVRRYLAGATLELLSERETSCS